MDLTPSLTPPSGVSGNYEWVQVVDNSGYNYTATNGTQHSCSIALSLPALDTKNPYPNSSNTNFEDSPALAPPASGKQSVSVSQGFSTLLMWQPSSNSIWLPVSSTNWSWGAAVNLSNGQWSLTSTTNPTTQVLYGGYWPVWYSTASGGSAYNCN